jgi:hypothetical protein
MSGDPSTIEQVITYGVPGAITLIAVWVGKLWERSSGTASWQRDQRLAAYADVLSTAHAFWAKAARLYRDNARLTQEMFDELNDIKHELTRTLSAVELLGPKDVYKAADTWFDAHERMAELVGTRGIDNSTPLTETPQGQELTDGLNTFVATAGRALE